MKNDLLDQPVPSDLSPAVPAGPDVDALSVFPVQAASPAVESPSVETPTAEVPPAEVAAEAEPEGTVLVAEDPEKPKE
jgi:hypothetical protein